MYDNSVPTRFLDPILQNVLKSQYRPLNAGIPGGKVGQLEVAPSLLKFRMVVTTKEDIREQPTPRNLSATATRVLLCTYMPCCSFSEIFFSYSHLTSPQLTSHLI
jgi:hypothetical protein